MKKKLKENFKLTTRNFKTNKNYWFNVFTYPKIENPISERGIIHYWDFFKKIWTLVYTPTNWLI